LKDHIERALVSGYISLLFTYGLIVVAVADIDMFLKASIMLMFGFLTTLFWLATISTVKKIIRKDLQRTEPLWPSKLKGVKRILWLALLAVSSIMATYILILTINQLSNLFEIMMNTYLAFMMWIIFVLEIIYNPTSSSKP